MPKKKYPYRRGRRFEENDFPRATSAIAEHRGRQRVVDLATRRSIRCTVPAYTIPALLHPGVFARFKKEDQTDRIFRHG